VKRGKSPQARVHALQVLEGLGSLSAEVIAAALEDPHPRVCERAVLLAEPRLKEEASFVNGVLEAALADDPRLRFQVALSLGQAEWDRNLKPSAAVIIDALAAIAVRDAADPWTRKAVASSVPDAADLLLEAIFKRASANADSANRGDQSSESTGLVDLVRDIAEVVGAELVPERIERACTALLQIGGPASESATNPQALRIQMAGVNGLGQGIGRRGKALRAFVPETDREKFDDIFRQAAEIARSSKHEPGVRLEALSPLRYAAYETAGATLKRLATAEADQAVRLAAIAVLARFSDPEIGKLLLNSFASQTPIVRREILDTLLSNAAWTALLLDELEAGRIALAELDAGRSNRLSRHGNADIRTRAAKLLAAAVPADRQKVLADYQTAFALPADPLRGREVFAKNCVTCHRIAGLGVNVAPDIGDYSRTKSAEQLLTDILDPNRAVDNNYFSYTLVTQQGNVLTGLVSAETASSVTLKQPDNKTVTVLREEIEELRSNGVSLMPVGVEKNITVQQMADLLAFIKNWRYLDGRVPAQAGK
jgi:putative heme-binding domain-containing protein